MKNEIIIQSEVFKYLVEDWRFIFVSQSDIIENFVFIFTHILQ